MALRRPSKILIGLVAISLIAYISFRVGYRVSEIANLGCHQKFVRGLDQRINQALINRDQEELLIIGNLLKNLNNQSHFSCADSVNMLIR